MNIKEKLLWVMLSILATLIGIIIFLVSFNKNNNINNKHVNKLENTVWRYIESSIYEIENGMTWLITENFNYVDFKIFNTEMEVCFDELCEKSTYEVKNDILTIESAKYFTGIYKMLFEDDYLLLEQELEDGSKMIHKFAASKG